MKARAFAMTGVAVASLVSSAIGSVVWTPNKYGAPLNGEVNISGATLFEDFFSKPASTNDYNDPDGNFYAGKYLSWPPQQLANPYSSGVSTFWLVNYRGVGSVNGLKEFLNYQGCGVLPGPNPSTAWINQIRYATGGVGTSPEPQSDISLAVLDVPIAWSVKSGNSADADWSRKPAASGYGWNPNGSSTGFLYQLESLSRDCNGDDIPDAVFNTNTGSPDADTLFDTQVAWAPTAIVANRGTGLQNIKVTELQHLYVTGRMPSGENLVAATRTPFSGTRNMAMNSIGVDPSWGRGDNVGNELASSSRFNLCPTCQPTNGEGSGQMENAVERWRLAVGYTGLNGSGRAVADAKSGLYEILNVMFDDRGGSLYIRPKKNTVLDNIIDNSDAEKGWQIGGPETFISLGNRLQANPAAPDYMANQAAADYLNNIMTSVENFISVPSDVANEGMPGEYLAYKNFLMAAIDAVPDVNDPTNYIAQASPPFNQNLQDYSRTYNDMGAGGDTPDFGTINKAGKVPTRNMNPDFDGDAVADAYSDGSGLSPGNANYYYCGGAMIAATQKLGSRNRVQGDFDANGTRDVADIDGLVAAYFKPRTWSIPVGANHPAPIYPIGACVAGPASEKEDQAAGNYVISEVIGDFNGDGDFNKEDLRYFMDGLGMTKDLDADGVDDVAVAQLSRKAAAIKIDQAILTYAPTAPASQWLPWADTRARTLTGAAVPGGEPTHLVPVPIGGLLSTGKTYAVGDFRGDVAGNTAIPGYKPTGWDGRIDCADVRYVYANFGDFTNLNQAVAIDLSADMNGDLTVDIDDVKELVQTILGAQPGDGNLDGVVDANDDPQTLGHYGLAGGWCDGDYNFDGVVDDADVVIWGGTSYDPLTIVSSESQKTHGTAGTFGAPSGTYEGRLDGSGQNPGPTKIVTTFNQDIQLLSGNASVTLSSGTVSSLSVSGAVLTVNLSGVTAPSKFTISYPGVAASANAANTTAGVDCWAVVPGEIDGTIAGGMMTCNAFDLVAVKIAQNAVINATSFRKDVRADGAINAFDLVTVKIKQNLSAPVCP